MTPFIPKGSVMRKMPCSHTGFSEMLPWGIEGCINSAPKVRYQR